MPLATHDKVEYDYITSLKDKYKKIGELINKYNLRIDTHPDQYAVLNSMNNKIVPSDTVIIGEVGLAGEIRGVTNVIQRVKEADKMGFGTCIIPKSNYDKAMEKLSIRVVGVSSLTEALNI